MQETVTLTITDGKLDTIVVSAPVAPKPPLDGKSALAPDGAFAKAIQKEIEDAAKPWEPKPFKPLNTFPGIGLEELPGAKPLYPLPLWWPPADAVETLKKARRAYWPDDACREVERLEEVAKLLELDAREVKRAIERAEQAEQRAARAEARHAKASKHISALRAIAQQIVKAQSIGPAGATVVIAESGGGIWFGGGWKSTHMEIAPMWLSRLRQKADKALTDLEPDK